MSPNDTSQNKRLTAPYNFATLSSYVHFPDWADRVSHDVPFRDGLCGSFDLVVTAKTALFTRDDLEHEHFLNLDGKYFLKGSSLRGMIRNVLKIASFGKMDRADERHFGFRDLSGPTKEEYRDLMRKENIKAGWLTKERGAPGVIEPCEFAQVSHKDLLGLQKERGNGKWNHTRPIRERYDAWVGSLETRARVFKGKYGLLATDLGKGGQQGSLVFTGFVPRKKREFFFYESRRARRPIDIPVDLFARFEEVHSGSQQRAQLGAPGQEPNENWGFWKERLERGERIPVFYLENAGRLEAFGLAMMFRMPPKASVHSAIASVADAHLDLERYDLADLIFGYAPLENQARGIKRKESLKGRVSITHADIVEGTARPFGKVVAVLSCPKASFYPAYLQQASEDVRAGKLTTWMTPSARVHGWKRYPARKFADPQPPAGKTERIRTTFHPLDKGAKFRARVYFHNLRPVELGALLWCVDFGGHIEGLVHRLGMAKPYGYGAVALTVENLDVQSNDPRAGAPSHRTLVDAFELYMSLHYPNGNWLASEPIVELLAMANPEHGDPERLKYLPGPDSGKDGFRDVKKDPPAVLEAPDGCDATLDVLSPVAAARRARALSEVNEAEERRRAALTPLERAREDVAKLSEQEAINLTRDRFKPGSEGDGEVEHEALREALVEKYYEYWSTGQQQGVLPIREGDKKRREYAAYLRPQQDAGEADGATADSPYAHLPQAERDVLESIGSDKGRLKEAGNRMRSQGTWSKAGRQAFVKLAESLFPPRRKMHKKDVKWLEEMEKFAAAGGLSEPSDVEPAE